MSVLDYNLSPSSEIQLVIETQPSRRDAQKTVFADCLSSQNENRKSNRKKTQWKRRQREKECAMMTTIKINKWKKFVEWQEVGKIHSKQKYSKNLCHDERIV